MATRQGGGTGSSRPPPGVRQEYEEFTPISEWREGEQSRLLTVYLPGFAKEQLRVSTEGTNTVRIHGERQIGVSGNKRSRFQKDFPIPEGCNIRGIRAKLAGGILTITVPYETNQLPAPLPTELESKTTTHQPPQPPPKEPEAKTATQQTPQPQPPSPPLPKELEAQRTTQQSPPPPPRSQKDIQDQQSAGKTLIPQKGQPSKTLPPDKEDQIIPATTITTPKHTSISSTDGQKQQPDGSIENERRGEESADDQRRKGDESLIRDELKSVVKEIVKKEEEREGTATATAGGEEADGGWFKIEKYTKVLAAVKRLAQTHLDHDDRELLTRMGVAALITLAFGAYIYYTLNSSLKLL